MEKRVLGHTGEHLSIVGFGGIVVTDTDPADAAAYVKEAIGRGINYFDVAPTYGNAQERLGPALAPYRDGVFLACKTIKRGRKEAAEGLKHSLKVLQTKRFDLFQLHGVSDADEVEEILSPGGALAALKDARDRGLTRFIGFSAHSEEAALALLETNEFDSILFPVNFACWYEGGFGPKVLEAAKKKGVGILALKSLARRAWDEGEERAWPKCWYAPVETSEEAALALRWTLSQGVTAAVSPSHVELLRWMCDAADAYKPITKQESVALAQSARGLRTIFPH